ncbi:MAG: cardiolipin synthase ClsB [Oleiphilaceae bacterium]|nr:cardiolipin synthase ClsB [Oleiphilaceae bacterium]
MTGGWVRGNAISLLENGDEFFRRMTAVINAAHQELLIETFMLRDDAVGKRIQRRLIDAAGRGVWISVLVDGYGSHFLPQAFIDEMEAAGIHFFVYHPQPKWLRVRANIFKRLHRKILVADGQTAFIGGINLESNHLSTFGGECKQDYAAELKGPIVSEIHRFAREAIQDQAGGRLEFVHLKPDSSPQAQPQDAAIKFVTRDNARCRSVIENEYLERITAAERRIIIANCYFFPGYRILKALRSASRRGVRVCLLTQGKPDSRLAKRAACTLYDFLVESDIEVYEYWDRRLHAKIAAFDDDWATIGSSNLDPLSLSLNLEANVFVRDKAFNARVNERIEHLIYHSKVVGITRYWLQNRTLIKWFMSSALYHVLRHLPGFTAWVPRRERKSWGSPRKARGGTPDANSRRRNG